MTLFADTRNLSIRKSNRLRHSLLLSTVITSSLLLSNAATAGGLAAAGCVDTSNATTCTNGSAADDMIYVPDSSVYVAGDFVLTLDNFDVNGGLVAVIGGMEGEALESEDDAFALDGNGTININNDSYIANENDPSVGVLAYKNATININNSSVITAEGDTDFTVGAFAKEDGNFQGHALITTATGSFVGLDSSRSLSEEEGTVAAIEAQSDNGNATVNANGIVVSSHSGIVAEAQIGNATVTSTGNVEGGSFGDAESSHAGIIAQAERTDLWEMSEEDALEQIYEDAPSNATVTATGNVSGNKGIVATADIGNANVTTGAGKITGDALGIAAGVRIKGDVTIITGAGDVEAKGATDFDGDSESYGIGSRVGDEELYLQEYDTGGNITVTTGGNVKGQEVGISLGTVEGDIKVTTAAGKQTTGTNDNGIEAFVGFAEHFDGVFDPEFPRPPMFANGGEGDIDITANGKVTGGWRGIEAWTQSGDVKVTTNDAVVGTNSDGILAEVGFANFEFIADGHGFDLDFIAEGEGDVTVNANKDVTGGRHGINTWTRQGDATVNVASGATIKGLGTGENDNADGVRVEAGYNSIENAMFLQEAGGGGNVAADIRGTVEGFRHGVTAWTFEGDTTVKTAATAKVIGLNENGIQAEAGMHYFEHDLNEVIGGEDGGGGNVLVEAGGKVTGNNFGVFAWTNDGNTTVSTLANAKIKGVNEAGISADAGSAYLHSESGNYISYGSGNATVDVAAGTSVEGQWAGVNAFARDGEAKVTTAAGSTVTATTESGIRANSGQAEEIADPESPMPFYFDDGKSVVVNAGGTVKGFESGIQANVVKGTANVTTTAASKITGETAAGIDVTAGRYGVGYGGGKVTVVAAGETTGAWAGIHASSRDGDVSVTAEAGSKTIATNGTAIQAYAGDFESEEQTGGNVVVNANGEATGGGGGIKAGSAFGNTTVTTGATAIIIGSTEQSAGINVYARDGDAKVSNAGVVEGGWTGVFVDVGDASNVREVKNLATGTIRNTSLAFDDLAIEINGGFSEELAKAAIQASYVENLGRVDGNIRLNGFGNINNAGLWNTLGKGNHAGNGDIMNAAAGRINAAHAAATAENTLFESFTFHNNGLISIADAIAGSGNTVQDRVYIAAETFTGGGVVALNAYLNDYASSTADQFIVGGDATGTTLLRIVNTNSGGGAFIDEATGDGILLAIVEGTAAADAFMLEGGTISTGLYDYYLVAGTAPMKPDSKEVAVATSAVATSYELFSRPNNGSAVDSVHISSGAKGVWNETTDIWEDRQENLRGGTNVTAVSSHGVSETASPGSIWLQGLYGKVDHKGSSSFAGRVVDTGFDQSVTGLVGGLDMGTELSGGGRLLFGVLGGFTASDVKFAARTNSMKFDGYSLGAYASFLQDGFFVNALLKGEFLEMKHSVGAANGKTDVTAIGVRADTGYRMGYGSMVVEPLVSLSYINTSVDDYSVGLTNFGKSSVDSLNAGAGARVIYSNDALSLSMTGRVWNNFSDATNVDVSVGTGATTSAVGEGAFSGIYGELSTSLSANVSDSVSVYGGGSLKIDGDTSSKTVFGGVNFQF